MCSLGYFDCDLIVDGILGIGIKNTVSEKIAKIIERINSECKDVVAIDIPTGINADTGQVLGEAIFATITVTFLGYKKLICGSISNNCLNKPQILAFPTRSKNSRILL